MTYNLLVRRRRPGRLLIPVPTVPKNLFNGVGRGIGDARYLIPGLFQGGRRVDAHDPAATSFECETRNHTRMR